MTALIDRTAATLRDIGARLRAAGVPTEALAEYVPERRKFLVRRRATMRPIGEVWRLGTLLLGAEPVCGDEARATGSGLAGGPAAAAGTAGAASAAGPVAVGGTLAASDLAGGGGRTRSSGSPSSGDPYASPLLFIAGRATRAAVRPYPGNQSVSREERRDIAAAALQGGYPEGTAVNFDAEPVRLEEAALRLLPQTAPLGVVDGFLDGEPVSEIRVRWRAGAPLEGAQTLAEYLNERAELLIHPPQSAG